MKKKQLDELRKIFKVHLAVLDFHHKFLNLVNEAPTAKNAIHLLHIQIVNELENTNPNMDMINRMLIMLENLAESNKNAK